MNPKLGLGAAAVLALALTLTGNASAQTQADPPQELALSTAKGALLTNASALHATAEEDFQLQSAVEGVKGLRFLTYSRSYKGLPVHGGEVVVGTDASGQVINSVVTGQEAEIQVGTTPSVTAATAAVTARALSRRVQTVSTPSLVVHVTTGKPRLAWEVVVTSAKPSVLHVFVDAVSGKVIDSYDLVKDTTGNGHHNGTVTIDTAATSATDPTRPGIQCGGQNGAAYAVSGGVLGNGGNADLPTACADVLYAVQKEWDMLRAWLNRNGIDGNGRGFPARVGLAEANAYWNGSYTNFGHNGKSGTARKNLVPMDVVGHEYGHAIFQTTPGGAGSGNEAGGLNESTGDIFGALVENYANNPNDPPDWLVGEETGLGSGPGGAIRNMANPSALSHPNCYTGSFPEVHAGAGPQNHWFVLTAAGTSASTRCDNGPAITGLGVQKAGQIFMTALNNKTAPWTHLKARVATLNAAKTLFAPSCTEFNVVLEAWKGINLGPRAGDPTCSSQGPDFSVSLNPASGTVQPGGSATTTVSTAVTSGAAQQITLRTGPLPAGVTATFNPATIQSGQSSTLTLATTSGSPAGTHSVTVIADGASVDRQAGYSLQIGASQGDDYSMALNPSSASVQAGSSATTTLQTTVTSGNAQQVTLSASGAPAGVTVSFSPATIQSGQSSTVTISVGASVSPNTYPITISGDGASADRSATFSLTVGGSQGTTWQTWTPYAVGATVTYEGVSYRCLQAHTSLPGWEPPNVPALWQRL
ncbi:M4 family metallopeptidase [Nonomuraea sp. NPDC050310]|uniref:M4 family metallopeptidase n=1 Tax=unclassified Nonomuraea TaxID=2593643 RepID=UPI0033C5DDC5